MMEPEQFLALGIHDVDGKKVSYHRRVESLYEVLIRGNIIVNNSRHVDKCDESGPDYSKDCECLCKVGECKRARNGILEEAGHWVHLNDEAALCPSMFAIQKSKSFALPRNITLKRALIKR